MPSTSSDDISSLLAAASRTVPGRVIDAQVSNDGFFVPSKLMQFLAENTWYP
jgi:hypothetical protein